MFLPHFAARKSRKQDRASQMLVRAPEIHILSFTVRGKEQSLRKEVIPPVVPRQHHWGHAEPRDPLLTYGPLHQDVVHYATMDVQTCQWCEHTEQASATQEWQSYVITTVTWALMIVLLAACWWSHH